MAVLLALVAALVSGTADYTGARAATRRSPLSVNLFVQSINTILLPVFAFAIGWDYLHRGDVVLGVVAGVSGGTAYLIFFRALAAGRMSVIAPLTALTTALVPVLVDLFDGVSLRAGRWAGVAMALIARLEPTINRPVSTANIGGLPRCSRRTMHSAPIVVTAPSAAKATGHWPLSVLV